MINTWFTADFHLGHQNIIRYCNRPFHSTSEMDEAILGNLNSLVRQVDVLYFLGDFCMGGPDQARRYRDRIVCRNIHVVEGNHDRALRHLTAEFSTRNQLAEIRVDGQGIVLCHYAMRVWHHSSRGSWHLYGHSHGKLADAPASLSMDVGVDAHQFLPWRFDEIKAAMEAKKRASSEVYETGKEGSHEQL
jgi:calcineurin-like phosphoesterase family protein